MKYTFYFSIICLTLLMLLGCSKQPNSNVLNYVITDETSSISFSPYDSDLDTNATVVDHLVGTLVKYGPDGRYAPFLAEKWYSTQDNKWIFELKENLSSEDGQKITAENYVKSLKFIFKKLAHDGTLPTFDALIGWKEFIRGAGELKGLYYKDDKTLVFEFDRKIEGLIDYLAMPYYGFYSSSDFNPDGTWKNNQKISSTGAYKVKRYTENEILLEMRQDIFSYDKFAPQLVLVKKQKSEDALKENRSRSLLTISLEGKSISQSDFTLIKGPPIVLTTIILSPYKENVFHDLSMREVFVEDVLEYQTSNRFESSDKIVSTDFFVDYPGKQTSTPKGSIAPKDTLKIVKGKEVLIYIPSLLAKAERDYLDTLFTFILTKKHGIKFTYASDDPKDEQLIQKKINNKFFDIRVSTVFAGSTIDWFIVKMIFCTKLGVSYPDPSGRMCSLTKSYEEGKVALKDFQQRFNQIYREDSSVIPMFHGGATWLVSKDIDLKNIASTMSHPRFDLIRFVK
ncbi:MAG: hypothetical protein HQK50_07005 [Oligoflexia bacterium]|nr:hypothetical protein [Oligoflexia bacterium]